MVVDFAVVTRIYLGVVPTTFWLNGPYLPRSMVDLAIFQHNDVGID
jgi:hypothetical protein